MRDFQLGRYIKKWLPLVFIFFVVMTALSYRIISKRQSYVASTVIEYCNSEAKDGLAPDGTEIDTAEIYSSSNMTKVMKKLDLSGRDYSLDGLCKSISVDPVVDKQAEIIQEAVNKEGEKYSEKPTAYIVSCTLDNKGSEGMAQMILDELMNQYYSDFSSKHINSAVVSNPTAGILDTDYDYLEMVELIDTQLDETLDSIRASYSRDTSFRSARTGYSYAELYDQFKLLQETELRNLRALILGNQITKDKELLISKYQNRIESYRRQETSSGEQISDILSVIDAYVEKMRSSGNTEIDYNYILQDVYGYDENSSVNRTVQYDDMLRAWLNAKNSEDNDIIQAAYCQYIIDVFNGAPTGLAYTVSQENDPVDTVIAAADETAEGGEPVTAAAEKTETAKLDVRDYIEPITKTELASGQADAAQIEEKMGQLLENMMKLYDVVDVMTEEYNEYLGARNIRTLSSTSVKSTVNVKMYTALIAFFFLVVGCCGAIVLGRLEDVVEYLFLKDHLTGLMNRVACDNYIHRNQETVLPVDRTCVSLRLINQQMLNEKYGREKTDAMMTQVGRILTDCYGNLPNSFIAHNGSGQFFAFFDIAELHVNQEAERVVAMLQQMTGYDVECQIGVANAGEENVFRVRQLISRAVSNQKKYAEKMD